MCRVGGKVSVDGILCMWTSFYVTFYSTLLYRMTTDNVDKCFFFNLKNEIAVYFNPKLVTFLLTHMCFILPKKYSLALFCALKFNNIPKQ